MLELLLQVVLLLHPFMNSLPMPNQDVEVSVHQNDDVTLQRLYFTLQGLGLVILQRIGKEGRLNHHQHIGEVFSHQSHLIKGRLVNGCAELLDKVTLPKVKHELREKRYFIRDPNGFLFIWLKSRESPHKFNQQRVEPVDQVNNLNVLSFEGRKSGDGRNCSLLIKTCENLLFIRHKFPHVGGHSHYALALFVHIHCLDLKEAGFLGLRDRGVFQGEEK